MRVKFTRDYAGQKGELPYAKDYVVDLDAGLAAQVIADGYAKEFARSDAEVAEQAAKYYAGDENRTPAQIADRIPQVVVLQGDTRQATEDQRGEDDPHVVRKEDAKVAAKVADEKVKEAEKPQAETGVTRKL
jgi:hypothetical protein